MHTETKTAKEVLAESDWAAEQAATAKMNVPTNSNQLGFQSATPQQTQPKAAPSLPARPTNNAPSLPSRPVVTQTASAPPAIPPKPSIVNERPSAYVNSRTGYVPKKINFQVNNDLCAKCDKPVYAAELILGAGKKYHKMCFRCIKCNKLLDSTNMVDKGFDVYCRSCYSKDFGPKVGLAMLFFFFLDVFRFCSTFYIS
jgi:LIM domain